MDSGGKDRANENRASFAALPHAGTALLFIALTAGDARLPVHMDSVGVSAVLQATRATFALAIAVALIYGFPRPQRLGLVLVSALTCMAMFEVGFLAPSRSMAAGDAIVDLLVGAGLLAAGVVWDRHTWSRPRTLLMAGAIGALGALAAALVVLLGPGLRQESLAAVDVMSSLALLLLLQVGITYMRQARRLQIDAVRSHERELIARDLHDGLGQDLATIVLHAERLSSQAGAEHPMTVAARNALAIVRGAMLDLSASAESSLGAALDRMAEELGARYGTQVAVRVSIDTDVSAGLETGARDEIVRIAREAIVNAATHGRAKHVLVAMEMVDDATRLRIRDDGQRDLRRNCDARPGLGMSMMQARASALGGGMTTRQIPGSGTEVEVLLPLPSGSLWSRVRIRPPESRVGTVRNRPSDRSSLTRSARFSVAGEK